MKIEHNNCSPLLAFGTYCLLHPRGRDCLCVCCRLQYALFTGRFGFKNNTSLEGIFIILLPFNHANYTSERKLRWDKVNSMSVLPALSSICPPPPPPPPSHLALQCQS